MANRIKGITIELDGNTTKLDKALQGVNKEIKNTQSQLKDVEKLLKLDPTNTELLTQKQKLLADAVDGAAKKLETLKKAQEQMAEAVKNGTATQEQYDALNREIFETETQLGKAKKAAEDFNVPVEKMKGYLSGAADALGKAAEKTKKYSAAAAGVVAGLAGMAVKSAKAADELLTMSKKTGISTDKLQELQYAADLVDVDLSTITGSMKKLTQQMGKAKDGTGDVADAFKDLGVEIKTPNGDLRDSEDVFNDVLEALSKIPNETDRDAKAMELLGRSAMDLNPLIADGGQKLRELGQEARDAGLIMSQESLEGAGKFNDALDRLKSTVSMTLNQVGGDVAEVLQPVIEKVGEWIGQIMQWLRDLGPENILSILKIATIVAAVSPVLDVLSKIASGLTMILNHPIIAAAAGIAALIGGIALAVGSANQPLSDLTESEKALFASIHDTNESIEANKKAIDDSQESQRDRNRVLMEQAGLYDDLTEATWKTIDAKKVEALLNANYDTYAAAKQQQVTLSQQLRTAEENYLGVITGMQAALAKRGELEGNIAEMKAKYTEDEIRANQDLAAELQGYILELEKAERDVARYGSQIQTTTAALEMAQEAYNDNMSTINNYERVVDMAKNGANDMSGAVLALSYGLRTAADADEETLQEQLSYFETYYEQMTYAVENNGAKISQSEFDTIQQLINITQTELKKVKGEFVAQTEDWASTFYNVGQDMSIGVATGMRAEIAQVKEAARGVAEAARTTIVNIMDIASPSKVMSKLGGFVSEGFAEGIADNASMVEDAMTRLTGIDADISKSSGAQVMAAGTGSAPIVINLTQPVYLGGRTIGNAITETVVENITAEQALRAAYVGV